jgi:fructokinase
VDRGAGVIVVGEALVDVGLGPREQPGDPVVMTAHAGGSPANVAVGLARLGVPTRLAARISSDLLGSFLRRHVAHSGVDTSLCVDASQPSTVAIVGVDDAGSAAYSFYVEGTADWQWSRDELPDDPAADAVHTGSLAVALEPGASVVAAWIAAERRRGEMLISLDPNIRAELVLGQPGYRERLDGLVGDAHLVKVSEEDLRALAPGSEPLELARAWSQRGPELVVVTHGAGGSTALRSGEAAVHCDAVAVEVVDTIGAGDAFTTGLLAFFASHGRLRAGALAALDADTLGDALRLAGQVAAMTCARAGADPPWRTELDQATS